MAKLSYSCLLANENVRRWYENVARGSRVTADVYLRRLGWTCRRLKLEPLGLIGLKDKDLAAVVLDFTSDLEREGRAGSYIKSCMKALKSWLSFNMRELKVKVKIRGVDDTPTLRDERVPTQQELKRILMCADVRGRVACVLLAHSGCRIEALGNYTGTDGLRLRDLPEMGIEGETLVFNKTPPIVVVRRGLSKAGHQYFTFLSEEGCEYLKDYLESRLKEGEELTADSPILTPKVAPKPFIRSTNIGDMIRAAIRKAGFQWRPYVLRSYFDTQLMLAESKGLILRDYRQFWMGHKGDIENRYTTNKCKLPESVIEDMREAYRRSQDYLQTVRPEAGREKLVEEFRRQLLLVAGLTAKEVDEINIAGLSDDEFQEMVRRKLMEGVNGDCEVQKAIDLNELEKYLENGWEYVATLPNQKVIVKQAFRP